MTAAPAQKPTWAAMASRNTPAASAAVSAAAAVKPQATIRPEVKPEQQMPRVSPPNGAPLPQRAPRYTPCSSILGYLIVYLNSVYIYFYHIFVYCNPLIVIVYFLLANLFSYLFVSFLLN